MTWVKRDGQVVGGEDVMPDPQRVLDLVERTRPLFAGQHAAVTGAALADLTAMWLASHVVRDDPDETDATRERLLALHVAAVRRLTLVNARALEP